MPVCPLCQGGGWTCEAHPDKAWNLPGGCDCSPGVPCPACSELGAPALEPSTLPNGPLTAAEASCFIEKEIG